ncbi:transglutaminase TgpA family protein [Bdellovibrio sp. BCCA]|uniref:transglutaminase TgpA family protein n=1 Tax=Bdellovibrio sp. BCCA TaxID=3136281 RepID=UPI0030F096CE
MIRKFYSQKALAASFVTAMAMVALEVSTWIAIFSFVMLFWKWGVENLNWKPLSRKVTGALSILLLVQTLIQFRTLIGQEPSYTFLLALSALRIMDYETERDHKFVVLLGFVLISVKSLFTLDIYWIFPSALAFGGLWYSLLPSGLPARSKALLKIFVLSIPLAVILFFVFPRFVLPWAMSRGGSPYGEIGFTDEINPGRVAELAANPAVAFRAKISDLPLKKSSDLYWRGSVLTSSRGLSWRPGRPILQTHEERKTEKEYTYEVAMEPTSQTFLFVLDGTKNVQLESNTVLPLHQSIFRASRPISKPSVYRAIWAEAGINKEFPDEEFLKAPPVQGRVSEWVENIKKKNLSEEDRLKEIQKLFAESGFVYTLSPGIYGPNDLEKFLFERKRGFCEHFAGAYATLARSLGIPSRVVVGYQGGRYNPLGDFWKIAQKDAHAWVEVYTNKTWNRIDPTMWVAPLRIIIGAEEFFGLSEEDQRAFARSIDWRPPAKEQFLLWDEVSFWVEDLNYRWTYFLIDFDKSSQQSLWKSFTEYKAGLSFALSIVLVLFVFIFRSLFKQKGLLTEEQVLMHAVEAWAQNQNFPRELSEPPLSFLERLKKEFPQDKDILSRIAHFYDQKIYARMSPEEDAKKLLQFWRANHR